MATDAEHEDGVVNPVDLGDALRVAAHSAVARALADSDEGGALSAWVGAAIAMVAMIAAAAFIGIGAVLWQRSKGRNAAIHKVHLADDTAPQKPLSGAPAGTPLRAAGSPAASKQAWHESPVDDSKSGSAILQEVRKELCETLRGVLEEEISRGLQRAGINERLDRLEQQSKDQQVTSGFLLPPPKGSAPPKAEAKDVELSSTLKIKDNLDQRGDLESTVKASSVTRRDAETLTEHGTRDVETLTDASQDDHVVKRKDSGVVRSNLVISPSARQKRYATPPERERMHVDEDRSLAASLVTVQRNLARRDVQTQELTRQLRACLQDCAHHKLEASHYNKRLQDLLTNPSIGTQAQADELTTVRAKVEELSGRLAETKSAEMQWSLIAKRQRAFFMQQERLSQEGINMLKRAPAGEIFLAPPPVYLEEDLDEEVARLKVPWDVGTSHANPYVTDSWPFEPNACSQRCAAEPNLNRWDEEDVMMMDTDSEDDSQGHPSESGRAQVSLRLPTLPPETLVHEGFDPPEPDDAPAALDACLDGTAPTTLTARSL